MFEVVVERRLKSPRPIDKAGGAFRFYLEQNGGGEIADDLAPCRIALGPSGHHRRHAKWLSSRPQRQHIRIDTAQCDVKGNLVPSGFGAKRLPQRLRKVVSALVEARFYGKARRRRDR